MKLFIVAAFLLLLSVSSYDAKPTKLCSNMVNCFVNPCQVSKCPAYPNARCEADYCGGCNARWYSEGKLINDCSAPIAKRAYPIEISKCIEVNCFVDPCAFAKCEKYPAAECRSNYCGGCNAWFYFGEERVECN